MLASTRARLAPRLVPRRIVSARAASPELLHEVASAFGDAGHQTVSASSLKVLAALPVLDSFALDTSPTSDAFAMLGLIAVLGSIGFILNSNNAPPAMPSSAMATAASAAAPDRDEPAPMSTAEARAAELDALVAANRELRNADAGVWPQQQGIWWPAEAAAMHAIAQALNTDSEAKAEVQAELAEDNSAAEQSREEAREWISSWRKRSSA